MYEFTEYEADTAVTDKTDQGEYAHMPPEVYYALALAGEAGEVAGKVKKIYRDHSGVWTPALKLEVIHELGDCLWYITRLAVKLGFTLAGVALHNILKIRGRQERGTLAGSGDNR